LFINSNSLGGHLTQVPQNTPLTQMIPAGPQRPVDASFRPVRAVTNVPSEQGPSGPPHQQETPAEQLDDHSMYTEDPIEVLVEQTQSQPQGT
jgi:hypothetical protein